MQAYQPITAVAGYTESYTRHAAFKSEAKIRQEKMPFILKL